MAVTLTEIQLAEALAINQSLADRLHPVAKALVEQYAPNAPEAVQNEATIRTAAFLKDTKPTTLQSLRVGNIDLSFNTNQKSALRHSGAMALLSPFKQRRAGVIG